MAGQEKRKASTALKSSSPPNKKRTGKLVNSRKKGNPTDHTKYEGEISIYWERHRHCTPHYVNLQKVQNPSHKASLALLETCRQIHSEAALLPFLKCNFAFEFFADVPIFMKRLLVIQQKAIRSITFPYMTHVPTHAQQVRILKKLAGLQEVTLFDYNNERRTLDCSQAALPAICRIFEKTTLTKATVCVCAQAYELGLESKDEKTIRIKKSGGFLREAGGSPCQEAGIC
ncbi:uncharacterized protein LTR77_001795 [Saxophila tyrrhenica]|uniref:Uncharacterized protein n=1 Tax=Saxophila tyrrhenica TaxID=1690608 RepID=A0AAV9PNW6_9PEZI|nr:hypothetical protein LTR77_001795 [Saxophila tyrrhenica]